MNLNPFKLERYFAKYEFSTQYLLCSSDCEAWTIGELLALEAGAHDAFMRQWLGYTESAGKPALRAAIADGYTQTNADQINVTNSGEEAIFWVMHCLLQAGDNLIVHTPHYQSHSEVAKGIGASVTEWLARDENAWALDLGELRKLIQPNTKAIVVNLPHNPTGWLMPHAQWRELHEIAAQHGVTIISDEVYRGSEYNPLDRLPAACDMSEHAISIGALSKPHGLPGIRIGWIATRNAKLMQIFAACKDYTTICNSAPSEFIAELALRHQDKLIARNTGLTLRNLALVDDLIQRYSARFHWHKPRASSLGFPKLLKGDVDAFCDRLVKQAGVLLLPGSAFDHTGNHFRVGLGRANLPEAVGVLERCLRGELSEE